MRPNVASSGGRTNSGQVDVSHEQHAPRAAAARVRRRAAAASGRAVDLNASESAELPENERLAHIGHKLLQHAADETPLTDTTKGPVPLD